MSDNLKLKFGMKELIILILLISSIFFFINYKMTGLRLFIGSFLLFFLPFYIFLDSFDLPIEEKLIFSFFIGLGIVSILVFYLTKIFGSIRISLIIGFIVLMAGSLIFRYYYKKKNIKN
ncbi:MAG: hypothetical protein ABH824_01050 [Nanoarchaeota archaeon]